MHKAYIVMAHGVHVVLQVTPPIIGKNDPAQLPVPCKVETGIRGENQQAGHVPPANAVLEVRGGGRGEFIM